MLSLRADERVVRASERLVEQAQRAIGRARRPRGARGREQVVGLRRKRAGRRLVERREVVEPRLLVAAKADEGGDPEPVEAPEREVERLGRLLVEPLHVVDDEQDGCCGGKQSARPGTGGEPAGARRRRERERLVERVGLRPRQRRREMENGPQHVRERGVGKLGLELDASPPEDREPVCEDGEGRGTAVAHDACAAVSSQGVGEQRVDGGAKRVGKELRRRLARNARSRRDHRRRTLQRSC